MNQILFQNGLTGSTLIVSPNGETHKLEALTENSLPYLEVLAVNEKGSIIKTTAENFRSTPNVKKLYKITSFNGHTIEATENQKFLLGDGQWVTTKQLQTGDVLKAGLLTNDGITSKKDIALQLNYILTIEELNLPEPVKSYSFTVENHQNLFIGQKINKSLSLICARTI